MLSSGNLTGKLANNKRNTCSYHKNTTSNLEETCIRLKGTKMNRNSLTKALLTNWQEKDQGSNLQLHNYTLETNNPLQFETESLKKTNVNFIIHI